jgi:hypothetical protein
MNEFNIFMERLLQLWFVKSENKALYTKDGFKVDYTLELNQSSSLLPSVQMVVRVSYKGQMVAMWGCMGEEDQKQLVDFFLKANFRVSMMDDKAGAINKRDGIKLFETGTLEAKGSFVQS